MMPHIAEELWQKLGHDVMLAETPWPVANKKLLVEDNATIAVQVNGKLRGTLEIKKGCQNKEIEMEALSLPRVSREIKAKNIKKIIIIPDRIINIVI